MRSVRLLAVRVDVHCGKSRQLLKELTQPITQPKEVSFGELLVGLHEHEAVQVPPVLLRLRRGQRAMS